ncbi:pyridoxamine 5'-phosphate oxidase family protein [Croceitalea sp. MTPC9]|uniref:pyridoxamine 5'-phosphate oxidase family protein n=1 Tax=unclassified Croceitalea TaxID=2632280 RepID=UPI002B3AE2DF|nr:pyridoxamine 5'-phosphate oxidase family protein [Croceitalea sp. MTPC6]GMN15957.1 pyridoxamine 5'-phosphate oxidase family protein [Croceitalea sp. MTPC9]
MNEKKEINKIRRIIEQNKVGMMATNLGKTPYNVFPMGTQQVDQKGNLWFFSNMMSNHFEDIQKDSTVQITYSNENKQEYLSIVGDAKPIMNTEKVNELWTPMLNAWFNGKSDPNLVLLNVIIEQAKHWDLETNQMVVIYNNSKTKIALEDSKNIVLQGIK